MPVTPPPRERRRRNSPDDRDSQRVPAGEPPASAILNGDVAGPPLPPDPPAGHVRPMREADGDPDRARRGRMRELNAAAVGALIDGDIDERTLRRALRPGTDPLMQAVRFAIEAEVQNGRRLGLTDRLAKEIGLSALGTLKARSDQGCFKSASKLVDLFVAPYVTSFQQLANGLAEPDVDDAIRRTLLAMGADERLVDGLIAQLAGAVPDPEQAQRGRVGADADLLDRIAAGSALLPVVLDGDNHNAVLSPQVPPDDDGEEGDDEE